MGKKKKEHITFDRMCDKKTRVNKAQIIKQSKNTKILKRKGKGESIKKDMEL